MTESASSTTPPMRVLFLCTHNSSRSQMAEGLLRARGGAAYDVFSVGTQPRLVHPLAIKVMQAVMRPQRRVRISQMRVGRCIGAFPIPVVSRGVKKNAWLLFGIFVISLLPGSISFSVFNQQLRLKACTRQPKHKRTHRKDGLGVSPWHTAMKAV